MQQPGYNPYQPQSQQPYPQGHGGGGYNPYAPAHTPGVQAYGFTQQGEHVLAERGTRFAAKLIDGLAYIVPFIVGGLMVASSVDALIAVGAGIMGLGWFGLMIYQWYLTATRGQTIGKRWLGIRIVKTDGSPCGFVHGVILRQWVMNLINAIVGITGVVDPLMIFGEERRCLHDVLASTKVVVATDDY